jgi:hypothetical protein
MSILSYHVGAEPGGSGSGRAGDGDMAMLRELGSKNGNRTENKKENVASERKAREKEKRNGAITRFIELMSKAPHQRGCWLSSSANTNELIVSSLVSHHRPT